MTTLRVLTINAGSTSMKIERYEVARRDEPIEAPPSQPIVRTELSQDLVDNVDVVVHRFVMLPQGMPGIVRLHAASMAAIREAARDAPLHDAKAREAYASAARLRPGIVQLAVSDSFFHRTISPAASTYAIPRALTRGGLRRIGYHGLSHEYAVHRGCAIANIDVARANVVTAHLGGGSSLCAVAAGRSIDTTMGFTPLEGLPMATRSGSVDPGLLLHLLRNGYSPDALEDMLERRSGLLGMSGTSGDVRDLLAASADAAAPAALDVLVWRLRSSLGAMIAVLGGVDLIVFTGGVGEHATTVRAAAFENGLGVGAALDPVRNDVAGERRIGADESRVAIFVVAAREGWQLARAAAATLL